MDEAGARRPVGGRVPTGERTRRAPALARPRARLDGWADGDARTKRRPQSSAVSPQQLSCRSRTTDV
jgi:hypothetical protein